MSTPKGRTAPKRAPTNPDERKRGQSSPKFRRPWMRGFLESLACHGNVGLASQAAGIHRSVPYDHRAKDQAFAEAWDDAVDESTDRLELECLRRAAYGTERVRSVRITDLETGEERYERIIEREYSDLMLIFLLKARRPEVYRDSYDIKRLIDQMSQSKEPRS